MKFSFGALILDAFDMDPSRDPEEGDSSDIDSTRTYSTEPKQPNSPAPDWTDMPMNTMQDTEWCVENGVMFLSHLETLHHKLQEWTELSSDLRDYETGVE